MRRLRPLGGAERREGVVGQREAVPVSPVHQHDLLPVVRQRDRGGDAAERAARCRDSRGLDLVERPADHGEQPAGGHMEPAPGPCGHLGEPSEPRGSVQRHGRLAVRSQRRVKIDGPFRVDRDAALSAGAAEERNAHHSSLRMSHCRPSPSPVAMIGGRKFTRPILSRASRATAATSAVTGRPYSGARRTARW